MSNKWMDNPILANIDGEKLKILTTIMDNANGLDPKHMLTYFISESTKASKKGINFTDAETDAILNVLKADMTPADIKKIDTIKKFVNMVSKRK